MDTPRFVAHVVPIGTTTTTSSSSSDSRLFTSGTGDPAPVPTPKMQHQQVVTHIVHTGSVPDEPHFAEASRQHDTNDEVQVFSQISWTRYASDPTSTRYGGVPQEGSVAVLNTSPAKTTIVAAFERTSPVSNSVPSRSSLSPPITGGLQLTPAPVLLSPGQGPRLRRKDHNYHTAGLAFTRTLSAALPTDPVSRRPVPIATYGERSLRTEESRNCVVATPLPEPFTRPFRPVAPPAPETLQKREIYNDYIQHEIQDPPSIFSSKIPKTSVSNFTRSLTEPFPSHSVGMHGRTPYRDVRLRSQNSAEQKVERPTHRVAARPLASSDHLRPPPPASTQTTLTPPVSRPRYKSTTAVSASLPPMSSSTFPLKARPLLRRFRRCVDKLKELTHSVLMWESTQSMLASREGYAAVYQRQRSHSLPKYTPVEFTSLPVRSPNPVVPTPAETAMTSPNRIGSGEPFPLGVPVVAGYRPYSTAHGPRLRSRTVQALKRTLPSPPPRIHTFGSYRGDEAFGEEKQGEEELCCRSTSPLFLQSRIKTSHFQQNPSQPPFRNSFSRSQTFDAVQRIQPRGGFASSPKGYSTADYRSYYNNTRGSGLLSYNRNTSPIDNVVVLDHITYTAPMCHLEDLVELDDTFSLP